MADEKTPKEAAKNPDYEEATLADLEDVSGGSIICSTGIVQSSPDGTAG